jgi:hypothetical protein
MDIRIQCLCVDSAEPRKIASFWEAALGWRRTFDEPDQVCFEPPAGSPEDGLVPDLLFLRVPESNKTVPKMKKKLHLDPRIGEDDVDTVVATLIKRGAAFLWTGQQGPHTWVTLADPEGNEFCVSK